jgi:hypothetical protein
LGACYPDWQALSAQGVATKMSRAEICDLNSVRFSVSVLRQTGHVAVSQNEHTLNSLSYDDIK